jgi:acetolactate decarboxylase
MHDTRRPGTRRPKFASPSSEAVNVLGFYSTRHRGIFTPRESDLHMHLRTADGHASGHVERIAVAAGATIAVPRKETR